MLVTVEFFGIPRARAGVPRMQVSAGTVGAALQAALGRLPALADCITPEGVPTSHCLVCLNGRTFAVDAAHPLQEGDCVLVLSADAGG